MARRLSRQLAAAQRECLAPGGVLLPGVAVFPMADLLGPEFAANADTLFASDRFHPSGLGYRRIGAAILPQ